MLRKLLFFSLLLLFLLVVAFAACVYVVQRAGRGLVYDRADSIPARAVGLLLGTSEHKPGGGDNPYFDHRIDAAAELYRLGKIKHLLVSGDNHLNNYDEPAAMKRALIALRVPSSAITVDDAGLRTLDSVVRAEKVFGVKDFTIISQRDHDERALLIAKHFGINAIAYAADDVKFGYAVRAHVHEWLAQIKVVLDLYLLNTQPKHLGAKETIH